MEGPTDTYSTYDAKAKFSEVIRKVRAGQRIRITHRGREIAEIGPVPREANTLEGRFERLVEEGLLEEPRETDRRLKPLTRRPGALKRFLESRE